jgi:hypothetical protein
MVWEIPFRVSLIGVLPELPRNKFLTLFISKLAYHTLSVASMTDKSSAFFILYFNPSILQKSLRTSPSKKHTG